MTKERRKKVHEPDITHPGFTEHCEKQTKKIS